MTGLDASSKSHTDAKNDMTDTPVSDDQYQAIMNRQPMHAHTNCK